MNHLPWIAVADLVTLVIWLAIPLTIVIAGVIHDLRDDNN